LFVEVVLVEKRFILLLRAVFGYSETALIINLLRTLASSIDRFQSLK
jgi:hypothetical protein